MSEEERKAAEAQELIAAEQLKKESEEAQEAERAAFAQGTLKLGMDLAKQGEYVASVRTFLDFIAKGGYSQDSTEYYTAQFGIANALANALLLRLLLILMLC